MKIYLCALRRLAIPALSTLLLPFALDAASLAVAAPSPADGRSLISDEGIWEHEPESAIAPIQRAGASSAAGAMAGGATGVGDRLIVPEKFAAFRLDRDALKLVLDRAPLEGRALPSTPPTILPVPMPDGSFAMFAIQDSPIMEAPLAAAFPEIRTFSGQGIDDKAATARFDWTPAGFHGIVFGRDGQVYIDPYRRDDTVNYQSYYRRDYRRAGEIPRCLGTLEAPTVDRSSAGSSSGAALTSSLLSTGPTLRTYRLAVGATGEYTSFHGGTVANGLAAITTTVNRVTGIYEKDFAIRLVLVANETSIIYTNASTDPYSNNSPSNLLSQNQTNLDSVIGNANYDIGHVFGTGGGGLSALGVVCQPGNKARSETGSPTPIGDGYDVDYVAHEMGHEFGGNHTFNGTDGNCGGGNRSAGAAYEVGSGTTVMAYAGICADEDLQPHSDPYFHTKSYDEITSYVAGGGNCSVNTATGNTAPTVDAGANYTIPVSTPFTLTATGSDSNGSLTYCWEEFDLGTAGPPDTDDGSRPIFRSFNPTASPSRTFPRLPDILGNTSTFGESLPTTGRVMTYRVTARDNVAGGGGSNYDFMTLTTTNSAGPFRVTQPDTSLTWSGNSMRLITWSVAGTASAPVNAANVKISLSTDGGNTFPTVLAASTPNDGAESVLIPSLSTNQARIKIEGVGNIFFDLSNTNFTITPDAHLPILTLGTVTATPQGGDGDGFVEPGEGGRLTIQIQNGGSAGATNVLGALSTSTPGVTVVTSQPGTYPNIPSFSSAVNPSSYVFAVSSSVACGQQINFSLAVTDAEGTPVTLPFSVLLGQPTAGTFSRTTPAVPIPDNTPAGVDVPITVSGAAATISDIDFSFDGPGCNANPGSSTVGLSHTAVGDLVVTLRSPMGTTVTLMDRPGGTGNGGNNFCQTRLSDGASAAIQSITSGQNPYTGTWDPANPLAAFNGEDPNGTWTLNVADLKALDTGTVRRFSLAIAGISCNAPLPSPGAAPAASPGVPLTVTRSGDDVTLSWGESCSASAIDDAIYEGTLGTWYSHTSRFCTTDGALSKTFTPGAGNRYFLVVPLTADREGSYGLDGASAERPVGGGACLPQTLGGCP